MSMRAEIYLVLCALILAAGSAAAQEVARPTGGVVDFLAPILPDPVLQHSKEIYVLYGCAYCHGVDLKVRNGEAADLLHSKLVGADVNGNLIGHILRSGIPQTAKLSPMPQFSDLSDQEIADIVQWIHYSRQQGRYKELMEAKDSVSGNTVEGRAYFDQTCGSCHQPGELATLAKKSDAATLESRLLKPPFLDAVPSFQVGQLDDLKLAAARRQHGALLENYSATDVRNLIAYVESLR